MSFFTHKDKQDCGWKHVHNRMDAHGPKYFWSTAPFKKKKNKTKTTSPVHLHSLVQHTKNIHTAGKDMHAEKEAIHPALGRNQR